MLIVAGYIRLAAGEVDKALPAVRKMVEETRMEAGCIDYGFARDLSDENVIRLFEIWDGQEALDRHFGTPHMAEFNSTISSIKSEAVSIKKYDVSDVHVMMEQ